MGFEMSEEAIERAKQVLGEPVLPDFSDELRRTKRNLLIVSAVAIFALVSNVKITESGFLGFKFSNPDQVWLLLAMLTITLYLFVQFCWLTLDYLQQTRLRITGTRVSHVTTGKLASDLGDYPDDPRQSTLYNWWLGEAMRIGNLSALADQIRSATTRLDELAHRPDNLEMPNLDSVLNTMGEINKHAAKLESRLDQVTKTFGSGRIPVSLERFDRWFRCFSKSQVARLFCLDIVFPFVLGIIAILITAKQLVC